MATARERMVGGELYSAGAGVAIGDDPVIGTAGVVVRACRPPFSRPGPGRVIRAL